MGQFLDLVHEVKQSRKSVRSLFVKTKSKEEESPKEEEVEEEEDKNESEKPVEEKKGKGKEKEKGFGTYFLPSIHARSRVPRVWVNHRLQISSFSKRISPP